MIHGVPKQRRFNRQLYDLTFSFPRRDPADNYARIVRSTGYKARVIPYLGKFYVYRSQRLSQKTAGTGETKRWRGQTYRITGSLYTYPDEARKTAQRYANRGYAVIIVRRSFWDNGWHYKFQLYTRVRNWREKAKGRAK